MQMMLAIAFGGALGAVLRHGAGKAALALFGAGFPVATLFVNVLGSFIMGILIGVFAVHVSPSPEMRAFLTVGVLGGFTTFSTFSLDVMTLFERGQTGLAALYILLSLGLSVGAIFLGALVGRMGAV